MIDRRSRREPQAWLAVSSMPIEGYVPRGSTEMVAAGGCAEACKREEAFLSRLIPGTIGYFLARTGKGRDFELALDTRDDDLYEEKPSCRGSH